MFCYTTTEAVFSWKSILFQLLNFLERFVKWLQKQVKLKLQAAMEGTSHPAPPTGGFRKTGNGEQCSFKKVSIEECIKVIYMCQTCCQQVALCL